MCEKLFLCALVSLMVFGVLGVVLPHANADVVGAWLFDEVDGDVAIDSSPEGNDGVFMGGLERSDDAPFGRSIAAAPNKYVDFPPPTPAVLQVERFTVMAWFKPNQWIGGWQAAFSMQAGGTGQETYGIYFGNNGGTEILLWSTGANVTTGPGSVEAGVWTHGAVTYDGTTLVAYKNGEVGGEKPWGGPVNNMDGTGRFVINGNYNSLDGGLAEFVDAFIDEVIIVDEALPQDEIQRYMNDGYQTVAAVDSSGKMATRWGNLKQVAY